MNWALLGNDPLALAVARAVVGHQGQRLVWMGEAGAAAAELARASAGIASGPWEDLLALDTVDVIVVARDDDEERRAEQLRKLVQAGRTLLVSHPVHRSMLVYFELAMLAEGTTARLWPLLPWRSHPGFLELFECLADPAGVGALEQVVIERSLADRGREVIERHFTRDVDLARALCGELSQLGALAPPGVGDQRFANVGVQLSGPAGVLVRWSVGPVEESPGARLSTIGPVGKCVLTMPDGSTTWVLETQLPGGRTRREFSWDPGAAVVSALAQLPRDEQPTPQWIDAARANELAETIERSLTKGRTIELYQEDYTETGAFKGTMAALGCAVLIVGLLLMIGGAAAAAVGVPGVGHIPAVVLAMLSLFLLLQLLRLIVPRPVARARPAEPAA